MDNLNTLKNFVENRQRNKGQDSAEMLLMAYEALAAAESRILEQQKRMNELEALASTDPLTGLMNRRGFEKFFAIETERLRRNDSKGCLLVLVDLDHFKEINDLFGHQAGDACLKMVARHLQNSVRLVDGAARLGGDEFALLLTQTDPAKAAARILRTKQVLDRMCLEWHGKKLHIGASLGIQQIYPESDYDSVYHAADQALYGNKNQRRQVERRPAPVTSRVEPLTAAAFS